VCCCISSANWGQIIVDYLFYPSIIGKCNNIYKKYDNKENMCNVYRKYVHVL
jgi:hypothetical protein